MKCDLLIIDGRHMLWRTADAFRTLSVDIDGEEIGTGAIYGFLSVVTRIHQRFGGAVAVAWEGENNFRFGLFPEYKQKAERDADTMSMIEDMNKQEIRLKAILRAIGVKQYLADGCEADDVIATLAHAASKKGLKVVVYTGDSDLRQLVKDGVTIVSPGWKGKESTYDSDAAVEAKHGVPPSLLPDLKALSGDSSDNIPGLSGIGAKRAAQLIQGLGDIEKVIKAAKDGTALPIPERHRESIVKGADDLRLYKKLTTVLRDARMKPIAPKRSQATVTHHLIGYAFRSLLTPPELSALMALGAD